MHFSWPLFWLPVVPRGWPIILQLHDSQACTAKVILAYLCLALLGWNSRHRCFTHCNHCLSSTIYPRRKRRPIANYQLHPHRLLWHNCPYRMPQCILSYDAFLLRQDHVSTGCAKCRTIPILESKHGGKSCCSCFAGHLPGYYSFLQDCRTDGRERYNSAWSLHICFILSIFYGLVVSFYIFQRFWCISN